jgi:hypothetical protein
MNRPRSLLFSGFSTSKNPIVSVESFQCAWKQESGPPESRSHGKLKQPVSSMFSKFRKG